MVSGLMSLLSTSKHPRTSLVSITHRSVICSIIVDNRAVSISRSIEANIFPYLLHKEDCIQHINSIYEEGSSRTQNGGQSVKNSFKGS